MMVDWVSAKIRLSHFDPIHGGKFISIKRDGEIEYETHKLHQVEGSYSNKISVKTIHLGKYGEIYVSGNPVKFLQGHNLFGSTDIISLMNDTLERIFPIIGIIPTAEDWQSIRSGNYTLTRVDLTTMQEMDSLAAVLAWVRNVAHTSRSRHKNAGVLKGDTMYWGKNSRRWAMKAYAKGQEVMVKDHTLPATLPKRDELIAWAQNKLRLELVLRGSELQRIGAGSAADFCKQDPEQIFQSYRDKIIMPDNVELAPKLVDTLPRNLRCTYVLWKDGEDLRQHLSKNTYYAHRRKLLKHGVDISVRPSQ